MLPAGYENAAAVEDALADTIERIRKIRATEGVLISTDVLRRFASALQSTPEGLRDETWERAMSAIRETLDRDA